jgi:hypothetical protein
MYSIELNESQFMKLVVLRSLSECYGVNAEWPAMELATISGQARTPLRVSNASSYPTSHRTMGSDSADSYPLFCFVTIVPLN